MIREDGGKYKRDDIVNLIVRMRIVELCSTKTILDFLMKEFEYQKAYCYELMKEASNYIADLRRADNYNDLEVAIMELQEQREVAKLEKNRKLALEISREIYKLQQLYVERVQHSGEIQIKTNWGDDTKDNTII